MGILVVVSVDIPVIQDTQATLVFLVSVDTLVIQDIQDIVDTLVEV